LITQQAKKCIVFIFAGNHESVRRRMIWNRWRDYGLEGSGSVG
jgi:hypothetical protein